MIALTTCILANLSREIGRDTHVEHDCLDLFHLLSSAVEFISRQLALDSLSDCDHVP